MKIRNKCDQHAFTLRYPIFMPRSVMSRLICRYGNLAEDIYWRNGIVFEKGNTTIHLECDQDRQVKVMIEQMDPAVISNIFSNIQEINERHPDIEVSVNGEDFVRITALKDNPSSNPQILATNGKWLEVDDFQIVLDRHRMKANFEIRNDNSIKVDQIKQLVSKNELKEALNLLAIMVSGQNADTVALVQRQLNDLERQKIQGVLSHNDESIEKNKIAVRILGLTAGLKKEIPIETGSKDPTSKTKPKIYFSYAWGDQEETGISRETIVDQLYDNLNEDGFQVLRDKMNVDYGGFISQFMDDLGQGDLILVFISEKYAKSPYCMFELYEIARNNKLDKELFRKHILPIPVERIRFDDPNVLETYFQHWEEEVQKWETLITKRMHQISQTQSSRYHKAKTINQNFGQLSDWLTDINSSSIRLLSENDFELVKNAVRNRLEQLNNDQ